MKPFIFILICGAILAGLGEYYLLKTSAKVKQTPKTENTEKQEQPSAIELDLLKLQEEGNMPQEEKVTIKEDPFFKTTKTYQAFSFNALLKPYMEKLGIRENSDAVVTFFCTDGYKPTKKLSDLLKGEGFLAYRDNAVADPYQNWPEEVQAKMMPFYLVWKDADGDQFTWPFGLYMVKIDKVDTVYDAIYPIGDEVAQAGFAHFEENCIKCHSINKVGGTMGPDLNYPKNITEYWTEENIWAYVKDPQSFRYNAKMPPVHKLTQAEFDGIMEYFKYIRAIEPALASAE